MRIAIVGARGRLGQGIQAAFTRAHPGYEVIAVQKGDVAPAHRDVDLVIDCAGAAALESAMAYAETAHASLLVLSTGHTPLQIAALTACASRRTVALVPNASLTILDWMRTLHAHLRAGATEVTILERHRRGKIDAPSGTALALARIAAHYGARCRVSWVRTGDQMDAYHRLTIHTPSQLVESEHTGRSIEYGEGVVRWVRWLKTNPPSLLEMWRGVPNL